MTSISVRQSGGANIVSLPKAVVQSLGLRVGSKLEVSLEGNKIVLTPKEDPLDLGALLAGSPKECFELTDEDRDWINAKPRGKEA